MFASRANNENAIYEQQTAAAAKPLNQGVKGLAPKTPGNKAPKTPFKVPLNNENAALGGGKTGGKAKQDGLFGEDKSSKLDQSAFVTPAGPRNRAPLGNKTTNAKATAFQTPAPPTQERQSAKHSSPRMRRAKIKVQEAEPAVIEDDEDGLEIEYMPPREVALPDFPDDWPHDRNYPQFEGKNLTQGWWSEFGAQKDEKEDDEFSDFEEKLKRIEELNEKKKLQAQQAKKTAAPKNNTLTKTARDPLTDKPPQSLKAKSAVAALSNPTKPTAVPRFAAPTTSARARAPNVVQTKKPAALVPAAGNPRHTAAKVASNSTLGYSKGRAVSSTARNPVAGTYGKPAPTVDEKKPSPTDKSSGAMTLDELFMLQDSTSGEDAELGLGGKCATGLGDNEDELEDFQLDAVEL